MKAENSSTLCKFHKWSKGLRPVGSNVDFSWPKEACVQTCPSLRLRGGGGGGNCTHRLVEAIFGEHFQGHYPPKIIIIKGIIVSFIGNPGS